MGRLLVLLPMVLWVVWLETTAGPTREVPVDPMAIALFLAGLVVLPLTVGWQALRNDRLLRQTSLGNTAAPPRRRPPVLMLLLGWHAMGLWQLDWGRLVANAVAPVARYSDLPGMLLACTPTLLAWIGLIAAEYPEFRRNRERQIVYDVEGGVEAAMPTPFVTWIKSSARTLAAFGLIPLAVLVLTRDAIGLILWGVGVFNSPQPTGEVAESVSTFTAVLTAVVLGPIIIARALPTAPADDSALMQSLGEVAGEVGMHLPPVRLWRTDRSISNAFAVGFIPGLRCILLSDRLVGDLYPEQTQAVFAHELGHLKHKHVAWYVLFVVALVLLMAGPVTWAIDWSLGDLLVAGGGQRPWWFEVLDISIAVAVIGTVLLGVGWLSRRFEREADIFAARAMQGRYEALHGIKKTREVGAAGATVFAQSLAAAVGRHSLHRRPGFFEILRQPRRLPPDERSLPRRFRLAARTTVGGLATDFLHGSVWSRAHRLHQYASRPGDLARFRRFMLIVRVAILVIGGLCAGLLTFYSVT